MPFGYGYGYGYTPQPHAYMAQPQDAGAMRPQRQHRQQPQQGQAAFAGFRWPGHAQHMAPYFEPRMQARGFLAHQHFAGAGASGSHYVALAPGSTGIRRDGGGVRRRFGATPPGSPAMSDDSTSRSGSEHGSQSGREGRRPLGEAMMAALRPPLIGTMAHTAWQSRMIGGYTRAERTARIMRWLHRRSMRPRPVRMKCVPALPPPRVLRVPVLRVPTSHRDAPPPQIRCQSHVRVGTASIQGPLPAHA